MSPGKKPNFSPASTAGLDKITLSIFFSINKVIATETAKKLFPVPAGPRDIVISFSFKALMYSDCFSDLAITDFFGVFINCLKLLTLDSSTSKFFFTDKTISSFSIIFVKKYLFIKNFTASQNVDSFSLSPLQVIELPLKKISVLVNLDKFFRF